ncbi:hypothetical protein [Flexithrix dorotheae]|uniref:hypothetical protein n=1 Tax=Flexithrix dorotheae TaxID=70993 RepID=UPI000367C1FD|nr:hypothetical protein [Flexithrix dorotheae]
MSLYKGYLRKKINFKELGNRTIYAGLFLGLSSAFALYLFSTFLQQILRLSSIVFSINLWELTIEEYNFYNYFFAVFAGIYGLNQTFNFWLKSSKSDIFFKYKYQKVNILTDINALFWVFILVFSRFALFYGQYFNWNRQFYVINLYPNYNYLFILILVVLFLQLWTSFLKIYGRKTYKLMVFSLLSIGLFSMVITKIQFIDFFKIDQHFLASRFESQYRFNLPTLPVSDDSYWITKIKVEVRMAFPKAELQENEMPHIYLNQEKSSFTNIGKALKQEITKDYMFFPEREITIGISVDKNMPVKYVKLLINNLRKYGYSKIAFFGYPDKGEFDPRFYLYKVAYYNYYPFYCPLLSKVEPAHFNDILIEGNHSPFCLFNESIRFGENHWNGMKLMFLKLSKNGDLWLNDKNTSPQLFKKQFTWFIQKFPEKGIIIFEPEADCTFEQYLNTKALFSEQIDNLRNQKAKELTGKNWEELKEFRDTEEFSAHYSDIKNDISNPILELSSEEKRLFLQILKKQGAQ